MKNKNRYKPHCKTCRMRMTAQDYCYLCRNHVCPKCESKVRHDVFCRAGNLPVYVN